MVVETHSARCWLEQNIKAGFLPHLGAALHGFILSIVAMLLAAYDTGTPPTGHLCLGSAICC